MTTPNAGTDPLAEPCPSCERDLSYSGAPGHECYTAASRRYSLSEEMAVVIAALLAGRIDGQQALSSATATARAHYRALLADESTVEKVAEAVWAESASPGAAPTDAHRDIARAALDALAGLIGGEGE